MTTAIDQMGREAHENAKAKGFEDQYQEIHSALAGKPELQEYLEVIYSLAQVSLIHSELSELTEAVRNPGSMSDHITGFALTEEEAADVAIRLGHFGSRKGLRIDGAIWAKMRFNEKRAHRHGKKA